jgi:hypothetical protein
MQPPVNEVFKGINFYFVSVQTDWYLSKIVVGSDGREKREERRERERESVGLAPCVVRVRYSMDLCGFAL